MFRTVISHLIGMSGNSYFDGKLRDLLVTVGNIERYCGKVSVGIRKLIGSKPHVGLADILLRCSRITGKCKVCLRIKIRTEFQIITGYGMIIAVVYGGITVSGDSNRHIDRVDRLVTVGNIKCYGSEVIIGVCKLILGKAHFRRSRISTGCLSGSAESKVSYRIKRITDFHIIAGHTMRITIKIRCIIVSGNRYRYVNRINCLVTISNVKRYRTKVRIRIFKLICRKTHVGCSSLGTSGLCGPTEYEIIIYIIKIRISSSGITGYSMLLAVISTGVVCSGNRYRYINWIDCLITIGYIKRYRSEVCIRIGKLICSKTHVGGSGIGTRGFCGSAKCKVCLSIKVITNLYFIAGHTMRITIIICSVIASGNCYRDIDRIDRQIAISSNHKCNSFKVIIRIGELIDSKVHVGRSSIGTIYKISSAKCKVILGIKGITNLYIITGYTMLFSIIVRSTIVSGNRYRYT